jgi:HD-GYP domain-containing protein (c-di-GMP phosphodiesterase class II)
MTPKAALEHLEVDIGKQFDPRVYEALLRVITRRLATGLPQPG